MFTIEELIDLIANEIDKLKLKGLDNLSVGCAVVFWLDALKKAIKADKEANDERIEELKKRIEVVSEEKFHRISLETGEIQDDC